MDVDENIVYNSHWKSGVCWGNLAGCLTFYYSLTGLILLIINITFISITSDYQLIFSSLIALGLIIVFLGIILLPLVFACLLGRQYHIYATSHAYMTFVINLVNIILIGLVTYEVYQLEGWERISVKFLLTDLAMLCLTLLVGISTWVTYVGRQFHEPNGQFILQL